MSAVPTSTLTDFVSSLSVQNSAKVAKLFSLLRYQNDPEGLHMLYCLPNPRVLISNYSFFNLHTVIHPRAVTEFCYRYNGTETAQIYLSFVLDATTHALRKAEIAHIMTCLEAGGMHGKDISEDELAKGHARYLVGGRSVVPNERIFRFGMSPSLLLRITPIIYLYTYTNTRIP